MSIDGRSRKVEAIAKLNDAFRQEGPPRNWMMTPGVRALGFAFVQEATRMTMAYADFTADNDPHGEHDFGTMIIAGVKVWFKIDYYFMDDLSDEEDPSCVMNTNRTLTLMLPEEY